jgi:hypothetical protein
MFRIAYDGSVYDQNGKIVFFSVERFISDIANGDCCFICGVQRDSVQFNDEHVIPNWLLRRLNLHGRRIGITNQTEMRYGAMTVPCCVICNGEMGERFERPTSSLFAGGFHAISRELLGRGSTDLFCWMALIFLKMHLKNKHLNYHRDPRKGNVKIAELHSWEELHHLHCVVRSFYSGAKLDQNVLGSLFVFPAKVRPHLEGFDFVDLTAAQTMLLSVGDVAIIAVLNDSQAVMNLMYEELNQKIQGALSPLQLRELTSKFAAINLQFEPRPQFASEIDFSAEEYRIVTAAPR